MNRWLRGWFKKVKRFVTRKSVKVVWAQRGLTFCHGIAVVTPLKRPPTIRYQSEHMTVSFNVDKPQLLSNPSKRVTKNIRTHFEKQGYIVHELKVIKNNGAVKDYVNLQI